MILINFMINMLHCRTVGIEMPVKDGIEVLIMARRALLKGS